MQHEQIKLFRRWRMPLIVTGATAVFVVIADGVILPLHERGVLQSLTTVINTLSRIVQMPGNRLSIALGLAPSRHINLLGRAIGLLLDLPIYFAAACLIRGLWTGGGTRSANLGSDALQKDATPSDEVHDAPPPPRSSERIVSRRAMMATGGRLVLAGAAGVGGYGMFIEPRRLEITRQRFPVQGLHRSLEGLRIVQLSDIHHGPWTTLAHVRQIVAATNALRPDLVLLTGDYVQNSAVYTEPVVDEFRALRAAVGVVGVLGNHDWWEDGPRSKRAFRAAQIPLVDNTRLFVSTGRSLTGDPSAAGLCIAGVGDFWTDTLNYDAALGGLPSALPTILLSHNPDVVEEPAIAGGQYRIDLMLSGHTHGGQICLPGVGAPLVSSQYGQKYLSGLVQGPACTVYVSRGLGMAIMPMRLGAPPEIAVIELAAG